MDIKNRLKFKSKYQVYRCPAFVRWVEQNFHPDHHKFIWGSVGYIRNHIPEYFRGNLVKEWEQSHG